MRFGFAVAALFGVNVAMAATPYERQMAGLRDLPAEVQGFIDRRANCNHWFGEDGYDAQRKAHIQSALNELRCADLERDETALKRRYGRNQAVLNGLEMSKDWSPG
jgi:hypothetical protein